MLAHPRWTPALSEHPRHATRIHSLSAPSLLLPFEFSTLKKVPVCFQVKIRTTRGAACSATAQTTRGKKGFPLQSSRGKMRGGG